MTSPETGGHALQLNPPTSTLSCDWRPRTARKHDGRVSSTPRPPKSSTSSTRAHSASSARVVALTSRARRYRRGLRPHQRVTRVDGMRRMKEEMNGHR